MTMRKGLGKAVVSLGACLLATQVHAVAFSDTSILGATGVFELPTAAVQSGKGKQRKENINALTGLFAGESWSLLDTTKKPSAPFNDVLFLLSADVRQKSGAWELTWDNPYFSPYMDFILLLKSGKHWGAYLFQAVDIDPASKKLTGNFEIPWSKKKGSTLKLRSASIYGRLAEIPVVVTDPPVVVPDVPTVVTDPPVVVPGVPTVVTNPPVVVPDTPIVEIDTPVVTDPTSIPTPGSLALFSMSLGLALRQLRQNHHV